MRHRGVVAFVLSAGLVVLTTGSTLADEPDEPTVESGVDYFEAQFVRNDAGSRTSGSSSGAATSGVMSGVTYTYSPQCARGDGIVGDFEYGCGGQFECANGDGLAYTQYATSADGTVDASTVCLTEAEVPEAAAPPQVTPGLVARAFRRVPLPESTLAVAPPGGRTLVGLETVLWTRAEPFTEVLTLLGQRVELEISPSSFAWSHGDGSAQTTTGPGLPYEEGRSFADYVTHAYTSTSRGVRLSVDTTWSARFRVGQGPWREVGETVTIPGDPVGLEVVEAEPNLVGTGG